MLATQQTTCDLCNLPVGQAPLTRRLADTNHSFCCLGCLNVYTILLESGVISQGGDFRDSEVYRQSLKLGLISNAQARKVEIPADAETREAVYHVSGMWCASCGWLIEHALLTETGILNADVLFASDLVKVRYCPQYVPPARIPDCIAGLGYRASEYTGQTDTDRAERRNLLLRIGVAAFLWLNVMTLSLVIYASYWESISDTARRLVPAVLMALTAPAVFYSAWPILRVAALGARRGVLRMEALLALGILAAYGYSSAQAVLGGKHYYFDTACAIVTLVLLGKLLERGAKERTTQALSLLYRMMPKKARLLDEGREHFVSIDALQPGTLFLVKAGERIPADAIVTQGRSHVDESILTGESEPKEKSPGDPLICGSLNTGGVLEARATRVGLDSTLTHIIRSVETAMSSRAPIARVVDRVARIFVPAVVLLAIAACAVSLSLGVPATEALMRAISVLVIACPCALGIATPLAITSAVGAASRRGILVSDSRVLEEMGRLDVLALDKTGTVTQGEFSVVDFVSLSDPDHLLSLAASVQVFSEHPVGRAMLRYAVSRGVPMLRARNVTIHRGQGVSGDLASDSLAVGNRALMAAQSVSISADLDQRAAAWEAQGYTIAFLATNGDAAGAMAFGDQIRPDAPPLVAAMHARGVQTILLSGDTQEATRRAAAALGVTSFQAQVLPEQKRQFLEDLKARGRVVAMVGDGVNDAPALAAANLGIALGSGADIAMQAAPVVLMANDLARVSEVFDLSRITLRVVRQNLFWAFFYNVAGITLALTGVLNPILAAGAMVLSSLSVIWNSMRLRSLEPRA
jgi:heavy metal translocating P-type ATPase